MISYIDASQRHARMSGSLPPSPLLLLIQWSQLNILGSNYVSLHRQGVVTAEGKGTEALKEVDVGGFRVAELGHSFLQRYEIFGMQTRWPGEESNKSNMCSHCFHTYYWGYDSPLKSSTSSTFPISITC